MTYLFDENETDHELERQKLHQWLVFLHILLCVCVESNDGVNSDGDGDFLDNFEL